MHFGLVPLVGLAAAQDELESVLLQQHLTGCRVWRRRAPRRLPRAGWRRRARRVAPPLMRSAARLLMSVHVLQQFRLRAATLPRYIGARLGEALLICLLP